MVKGQIMIICGEGKGKTSAAIGRGITGASNGKSVIIIRFLKGKVKEKDEFIKRLEPDIKVFSFEKWDVDYQSLSPEQQAEEAVNIRNGLNFARKVMTTTVGAAAGGGGQHPQWYEFCQKSHDDGRLRPFDIG